MMGSSSTKGADLDSVASLFDAIKKDNYEQAMTLVSDRLDCRNLYGCTPLIATCRNRSKSGKELEREKFVKFLVESGCDIRKCDIYGNTALVYAEKNGYTSIVYILMRKELKLSLIERRGMYVSIGITCNY